jgi:Zn-dependent protease
MPTRNGSFRLFQIFGITVYLHWSWFLLALVQIQIRRDLFDSITWDVLSYLTLFLIVLTHEFGHALACRSVGGKANQIVLWPLGGVAYVSPPQRPGAQLWSIAAGPLVNVILVPVLSILWWIAVAAGWSDTNHDVYMYVVVIWYINLVLLVFNMLPIYPLDGGQILRSLLWFFLGRARSLMVACILGFIGAAALIGLAIWMQSLWTGAICVFIVLRCFSSFTQAKQMLKLEKAPRYEGYHCPSCKAAPPAGDFWSCGRCRKKFDAVATQMVCPHCDTRYERIACFECGTANPLTDWLSAPSPPEPPHAPQ